jgi:hypothetical protein
LIASFKYIQTSTENTYACKNATPNSKNNIAIKKKKLMKKNQNLIFVIFNKN